MLATFILRTFFHLIEMRFSKKIILIFFVFADAD